MDFTKKLHISYWKDRARPAETKAQADARAKDIRTLQLRMQAQLNWGKRNVSALENKIRELQQVNKPKWRQVIDKWGYTVFNGLLLVGFWAMMIWAIRQAVK